MKYITMKAIDWERFFRETELSPAETAVKINRSAATIYAYIDRKYLKLSTINNMIKNFPEIKNYIIEDK